MNDDKGPSPTSVDKALEFADAFVEGGALLRHDLTLTCKFLAAEVRRLRARDAEYKQLTEDWARVERKCETVQGINDRLQAENAELRKLNERVVAENSDMREGFKEIREIIKEVRAEECCCEPGFQNGCSICAIDGVLTEQEESAVVITGQEGVEVVELPGIGTE